MKGPNSKLLPGLALVLSGICSTFAYAVFIQLKPAEMRSYSNILIQSEVVAGTGNRKYFVVLLPQKNFSVSNWQGNLAINDGTNHLATCAVDGVILSEIQPKNWSSIYEIEHYMMMTNRFSRSLNGAKEFTFQVNTNLLPASTFTFTERYQPDDNRWFYLKDFCSEK